MKTHTKIEMKEMMDRKKENISGKGDKEGKDLEGGEGRGVMHLIGPEHIIF